MPAVDLLQRIGDLPHRGVRTRRIDRQFEKISVTAGRGAPQLPQRGLDGTRITFGAKPSQLGELLVADPAVLDLEHLDGMVLVDLVLVDPDYGLLAGIDPGLRARRRLLDAHLRDTVADRLCHAAVL